MVLYFLSTSKGPQNDIGNYLGSCSRYHAKAWIPPGFVWMQGVACASVYTRGERRRFEVVKNYKA